MVSYLSNKNKNLAQVRDTRYLFDKVTKSEIGEERWKKLKRSQALSFLLPNRFAILEPICYGTKNHYRELRGRNRPVPCAILAPSAISVYLQTRRSKYHYEPAETVRRLSGWFLKVW